MYSQVVVIVGLVCTSLAYPRTYQEQRQIYYSQPLPIQYSPYRVPQQQVVQYQVPASTSFLPNNVPGLRYGQQQVVYVVPGGGQLVYDEASSGGQGSSQYLESFMNFLNGHLPTTIGASKPPQTPELPAEKPDKTEEKPAENTVGAAQEQEAAPQEAQPAEALKPQPESIPAHIQPQQYQQLPIEAQPIPLSPQTYNAVPSQQEQQLLQQQLLQQRLFFLNQQQQQPFYNRQAFAAPSANYLLNYRNYPLSDKKPGSSAIAFQKLLQKNAEAAANNNTESESAESDPSSEDIGPSIAQAKPQAVSVAGPGGVAAAAPVGTAIVGPGGMALSAPTATAVAGTKPKPSDKTKSSYLSRSNLFPY